jgi:hypothetical protein
MKRNIIIDTGEMSMLSIDAVEPTIKKMPPELQQQVLMYIETLSRSTSETHHGTMKFEWAGCCEDMKNEYTSVQLQKKILDWWNELYLLDTNIFLEVILSREYSKVIQDFLNRDITTALFVSDFSVFSVGIFLVRRNLSDQFGTFIEDLEMRDIRTISINANELKQIPPVVQKIRSGF